jgi:hypothetical protein
MRRQAGRAAARSQAARPSRPPSNPAHPEPPAYLLACCRLVQDDISCITLYAEPNVVGLYEKLGFVKDPEGIRGMAFQRKRTAAK